MTDPIAGGSSTGDDVEQRRLAGPVRPDDGEASTGFDDEVDAVEDRRRLAAIGRGEPLADIDQLDHLIAEPSRSGAEFEIVGSDAEIARAARHDLARGPQPSLGLRRPRRRAAAQPGEFLAGEDLARRLLLHFALLAFGTRVEIGGIGAGAGRGLVDEAATVVEFDHLARPDAVVSRSSAWRSWVTSTSAADIDTSRDFEPLDRFEIEVVGGLVEHDHVVSVLRGAGPVAVVGEHLGERHTLGLPARQLGGRPVEQRQHTERGGDGRDLPPVAEVLRDGPRRATPGPVRAS